MDCNCDLILRHAAAGSRRNQRRANFRGSLTEVHLSFSLSIRFCAQMCIARRENNRNPFKLVEFIASLAPCPLLAGTTIEAHTQSCFLLVRTRKNGGSQKDIFRKDSYEWRMNVMAMFFEQKRNEKPQTTLVSPHVHGGSVRMSCSCE
jgi:hypothetical protein